jgi:2-polyprenyl-3-methyl-5-hydroxy-6-metoxy-1,4-benzoquinol methylase
MASQSGSEQSNGPVQPGSIHSVAVVPTLENTGGELRYEFEIDLEADSVHASVVGLAGESRRVLELGCATGYMSEVLRARGCYVVGVERDPLMAELAEQRCDRLIVGDLDLLDLAEELAGERFDVIVAADVLEHLRDPLHVLRSLRPLLAENGYLVASIPNVAHGSVRLALLEGRFPYQERGLLDRTHLRFFTRESIGQLLEDAGFLISDMVRHELILAASEVPFEDSGATAELRAALDSDPDATTYQFVVKAFPLEQPGMRAVHEQMRRLALARELGDRQLVAERAAAARELGVAREAAASRSAEHEELVSGLRAEHEAATAGMRAEHEAATAGMRAEHETMSSQLAELQQAVAAIVAREGQLREALVSAHDQILRRDDELTVLTAASTRESAELREAVERTSREFAAAREELDHARRERDAIGRRALELQIRLDRIHSSPPVLLYSTLKSLPGLRAMDARRTSAFKEALRRAGRNP